MPETVFDPQRISEFKSNHCPILEAVDVIDGFSFIVRHPQIKALAKREIQEVVADFLTQRIGRFLTAAQLHRLDLISLEPTEKSIVVTYADDIYHFQVSIDDEFFEVRRASGPTQDFVQFYQRMPLLFVELYNALIALFKTELQISLSAVLCQFKFSLHLWDFRRGGAGKQKALPNYELLRMVLPFSQPDASPLAQLNLERYGSATVNLGGWKEICNSKSESWVDPTLASRDCALPSTLI